MITRDEIIRMASMAGFETKRGMVFVCHWEVTRTMERFFHAAYAAGAAAEREACAKVCEELPMYGADDETADWYGFALADSAAAIRARGEK